MSDALHISLPGEVIFHLGPIAITNGHLAAFLITVLLGTLAYVGGRRMSIVPTKLQVILEIPFLFVREQLVNAFGSREEADKFMPLIMTLLLFIIVANQFSLIPLITSITLGETPLLRLPTSDLAQTFAMSLIVIVLAHVLAFRISPIRHIGNYIKIAPLLRVRSFKALPGALLDIFLGVLDIISEIAKVVSLAARLFGNVFAGEVMVMVIASLSVYTMFLAPIPFYVLSIFSGFVQAMVFALLSVQFIAGTVSAVRAPEEVEDDNTGIVAMA